MKEELPKEDEFDDQSQPTLLQEIVEFIVVYRKWWLIPIVCSLGLIGLLAILAATGAAPFIYTVF